jgi:2'-5' RNA ligase
MSRSTQLQTAEQRFDQLWQQARQNLLDGNIVAAKMNNGATDPVDYCLSTIAPLYIQAQNPIETIETIKNELLLAAGGDQFFYPRPSIHISLLACTQRAASPEAFSAERIRRIGDICAKTIAGTGRVVMQLRGVNLIGNQVFIQAFPQTYEWTALRQKLEEALLAAGETPITHPDKAPVHVNLMRLTATSREKLTTLLHAIERLRRVEIGNVTISEIELVLTDFVVSAGHTKLLRKFTL